MTGRQMKAGEFNFKVTENGNTVATGTNDANGKIDFTEIEYELSDVRTHTYSITEKAGNAGGVTYDRNTFEVKVTVTDNGNGTLKTEVTYPDGGVKFKNTYKTESTKVTLEGTKELTGRKMKDGEFKFTVTEDGKEVTTGTNDVNGKINFTEIEYELSDIGTHIYSIIEDSGDKGGIEYSRETYSITVTISDNGDGTLNAKVAYPEDGIVFHNKYTAAEVFVTLGAKKTLTGAELKENQFKFELKDKNNKVIETVSHDVDGNILFDSLSFTEAGEYIYTISEVQGNEKGMTYDSTTYTVKITVTDDENGTLIATIDTDGKDLVFNNTYKKEESKKISNPKTGDSSHITAWLLLAALSIFTMIGATVVKRNKYM